MIIITNTNTGPVTVCTTSIVVLKFVISLSTIDSPLQYGTFGEIDTPISVALKSTFNVIKSERPLSYSAH